MTAQPKRHYSVKERRQAFHIEQGYEKKGLPVKRDWAIAWATVRKLGGGRQAGTRGGRP